MISFPDIELSEEEVEFTCHILDELDNLERQCLEILREGELRELAIRLRQLLSPNNPAIVKFLGQFKKKTRIYAVHNSCYLAAVKDANSSSTRHIEFIEGINKESVQNFVNRNRKLGFIAYGIPVPGNGVAQLDRAKAYSIEKYMNLPVAFVNENIISRHEIIEFSANKKGLAHYDNKRKNDTERSIDILWNLDVSLRKGTDSKKIRSVYNIVQLIALETLSSDHLLETRKLLLPLRAQFGR